MMDNTMNAAPMVGLIALLPGLASTTRVRSTLETLFRHAEAVVLGEVQGVAVLGDHRYADIQVARVIKGDAEPLSHVIAESTWRCSVNDAVRPGTRVVLFLGKRNTTPVNAPGPGHFPFMSRARPPSDDVSLPSAIADEVKRDNLRVVLTNEVFVRYLSTFD